MMLPPRSEHGWERQKAWCDVLIDQPWLSDEQLALVKRLRSQFGSPVGFILSTNRLGRLMDLVGKASLMGVAFPRA